MEITFGSKDDVKSSKPTLKKLEVGNSEILKKENEEKIYKYIQKDKIYS